MLKTYILKHNEIQEKFVAAIMETPKGDRYYYLVDSEDSTVDMTRPIMTTVNNTFCSPQAVVNKLMEKWHEIKVEHEGQKKFQFDGDTDSITYPPEEVYPEEDIRVGTMREDTETGVKEIYSGYNWVSVKSVQGDILYRKYYTNQNTLDPVHQLGQTR